MAITTELEMEIEGLSDVEATIDFTNPKDFTTTFQALFYNAYSRDPTADYTVLVRGFPNKYFEANDDDQSVIPRSSSALYFRESQILLLTMRGGPHEAAAKRFSELLIMKIGRIGCFDEIHSSGEETASIGSIRKEPDASWGPSPTYVTCVVESGVSESGRRLRCDAKIWLEHEESKVSQVITINVNRRRPEIIFSVWKRRREQQDLRESYPVRAVVDQEVRITLQAGRPVADGMLRLSFEEIFERKPQPGTGEGDFSFSACDLGGIARKVWSKMGFDIE
ncbi:hypothetical protein VE03_04701 [Pseudogymnoascus sp. 23342-1-I1]|nr:hypothetical protein VE03_04701 [Pseudogymnoascus sp. 23342-1-I1]